MPQMAPIQWLTLFLIFSFTFFIFSMLNYYSVIYPSMLKKEKSFSQKKINWKW
uniref:ATP synthase complex subunit 8 n=1 Tax=Agrilus discalis TaxID=3013958 RepID=A0A9E9FUD4_9COLE|nr:ATP synthase F0 subunit 8 [Agrilus discalis]WAP90834.1 ATP synthase F0 subunit 8 [Agrilus discalis]